jgi:hypothetical protein
MRRAVSFALAVLALASADPAGGFTFFDGKLEVHGYYGQQIRAFANDFDPEQELDLAQWNHIFDLELEAKPFPAGLGPLEIVEFYVRAEARYDCVWTRACGLFPSVNTYGSRARTSASRTPTCACATTRSRCDSRKCRASSGSMPSASARTRCSIRSDR